MARGRFITKDICLDKTVNDINDPWSMLAFTWLITHADCEGRVYGDPAIVKSLIFPRRTDITIEQIDGYITEWNSKGLIILYEVDGDRFIEFPNFLKHQVGLIKDREAKSNIPARVNHELVMSNSCNGHAELKDKLNLKSIKVEDEDEANGSSGIPGQMAEIWRDYTGKDSQDTDWQPVIAIGASADDLKTALDELIASGKKLPRSPDRCVASVLYVVQKRKAVPIDDPDKYARCATGQVDDDDPAYQQWRAKLQGRAVQV